MPWLTILWSRRFGVISLDSLEHSLTPSRKSLQTIRDKQDNAFRARVLSGDEAMASWIVKIQVHGFATPSSRDKREERLVRSARQKRSELRLALKILREGLANQA